MLHIKEKQGYLVLTIIISTQEKSYLVKIIFNEFCISLLSPDVQIRDLVLPKIKPNGIIMTTVPSHNCQVSSVTNHNQQR